MIEFTIDENGVFIIHFIGNIDYLAINNWLTEFSGLPAMPLKLFLLYDLRKAILHIDEVDLAKIIRKTDEITSNYQQIRTTFILNETNISNYAGLFSFLKPNFSSVRKAFATFEDAYKWLIEEKTKAEMEGLEAY